MPERADGERGPAARRRSRQERVPEAHGPLHGLRVIEAATLAAGPMCGTALAEYGAEVIKVEQPGSGDPMRTWGNRREGIGLVWKSVGRNKRCVTLDLRQSEGQALFHQLLHRSDVLVVATGPAPWCAGASTGNRCTRPIPTS